MKKARMLMALLAGSASAQTPAAVEARLDSVMQVYLRLAERHGESIWPGFRPDTIPVAFVHGGSILLFNWKGPIPEGFVPGSRPGSARRDSVAAGAASTSVRIGEHTVAQVVLGASTPAELVATAMHEAFHAFQATQRTAGRRFGTGENAFYVATYPIFDVTNEALFVMETALLADGLESDAADQRNLAAAFVAVRRERHRRLNTDFAEFDRAAEMNEGLAEYALVRTLEFLVADEAAPESWRNEARADLAGRIQSLRAVPFDTTLSLRFRFYHTGSAMARLLDRLDPQWKNRVMRDNYSLQDALGLASGLDAAEQGAFRTATARSDSAASFTRARAALATLQRRRERLVDSVLGSPGILLVVRADSLPTRSFNMCGFDPQNHLQVNEHISLQTRWWRPCSGGPTYAEFSTPSVHDTRARSVSAVIAPADHIALSADGKPVPMPGDGETIRDLIAFKLTSPRATVEVARADITRSGRQLTIWAKRAP